MTNIYDNLLRYVLGAFFVIFGITKIIPVLGFGYGFGGTTWFVGTAMGYPFPEVAVAIAIVVELGLGAALLVNYRTGLAAVGLLIFTALATVLFHLPGVGGETLTTELTAVLKNLVVMAGLYQVAKDAQ